MCELSVCCTIFYIHSVGVPYTLYNVSKYIRFTLFTLGDEQAIRNSFKWNGKKAKIAKERKKKKKNKVKLKRRNKFKKKWFKNNEMNDLRAYLERRRQPNGSHSRNWECVRLGYF